MSFDVITVERGSGRVEVLLTAVQAASLQALRDIADRHPHAAVYVQTPSGRYKTGDTYEGR